MPRRCLWPECKKVPGRGHITCLDHWHELPQEVRREIQLRLRCWRNMGAAREYLILYTRRKQDVLSR